MSKPKRESAFSEITKEPFRNTMWLHPKPEGDKPDSAGKTILQILSFLVVVGVLGLMFGH